MSDAEFDALVHHAYVDGLRREGRPPNRSDVALQLQGVSEQVEASLLRLEKSHGVVLHPHVCEPWVIHPFSTSPTAIWVEGPERGWWAPCIWCGLGVAKLVGGSVTLHARLGGERDDVDIRIEDGRIEEDGLLVHFAIPPRASWDNVHHFCATVLPFRREEDAGDWSRRHGLPLGRVLPISQVMALASAWYGRHGDPDWRKWTAAQASDIFRSVGLTDPFWRIEQSRGTF